MVMRWFGSDFPTGSVHQQGIEHVLVGGPHFLDNALLQSLEVSDKRQLGSNSPALSSGRYHRRSRHFLLSLCPLPLRGLDLAGSASTLRSPAHADGLFTADLPDQKLLSFGVELD